MTPVRESITLPLTFLTVVLVGGLRLGGQVAIAPPALFSLVLASLVLGGLVQSGVLDPMRLVHSDRTAVANLNGVVALVATFAATAQVLSLLTPAAGLPSMGMSLFFLVAILQLMAGALDRPRFLRVWAVTLLAAFTLKFIVLAALSGPADGAVARALQLLFEGVTLGSVSQPIEPRASGYLAFLAIALYLLGLVLLPPAQRRALIARH
ncbi:MAG: hypothetical protein IT179_13775 [Acidobacteria bacterium]|nr:hypothetical protein [Acidobacteriota bacterium]